MHALIYASLILLLKSPRATAKPIPSDNDLSADYSLFIGDDSDLVGTGDDLTLFGPPENVADLSAAGSSCSTEVSLSNNYDSSLGLDPSSDLFVRDLDDNLFAGKKPATCVDPNRSSNTDRKPDLQQFEMLLPIDPTTHDGRCSIYGRSVLACCDYSTTLNPPNCRPCA